MLVGHLHDGGRPTEMVAQELGYQCQGAENLPQQWDLLGVCGGVKILSPALHPPPQKHNRKAEELLFQKKLLQSNKNISEACASWAMG